MDRMSQSQAYVIGLHGESKMFWSLSDLWDPIGLGRNGCLLAYHSWLGRPNLIT